jgi:molybdopterin-binding protein
MKLGMENILKGKVVEIQKGMIMTKVKVDIGGGDIITAIVTDAALKELDAKVGDELEVLKTTGVMEAARDLH